MAIVNTSAWWALRPRMGRRCHNWDYKGRGVYLITVAAKTRGRGVWGAVEILPASGQTHTPEQPSVRAEQPSVCAAPPSVRLAPEQPSVCAVCAAPLAVRFIPNATGRVIARAWAELTENWPGVKLLASQVMEDHFHGIIETPSFMAKPLGSIIGSFKSRASSAAGRSLWGEGYVDTILFDDEAVKKAIDYVRDNPRRLAEKRAHPELFKVLRNLELRGIGHFAAIGNHHLLEAPVILQLQCSRSDFAYARNAQGEILRDVPPRVKTAAFDEKLTEMMSEISHGAVVVCPCISEGERELAHQAFAAGARVITLANQGFSPLYKPGGRYFEACADARLLMLAPAAWPYQPGEKPITRESACVLNRIAQLIAGSGAAAINYRGMQVADIERLVAAAVRRPEGE